jgi:hypothetical protein
MTSITRSLTRASFLVGFVVASLAFAGSSQAAVIFTVIDQTPNGDSGTGTRSLSTTLGNVAATPTIPTTTYTITNLDLTSVGGGASETIAFNLTFSHSTGTGTGVQFNGFGNLSVTGGDNNQIDLGEALTVTLTINGATTFSGDLSLGLIQINAGGVSSDETWDVIHDGGTIGATTANNPTSFATSDFVTLKTTDGAQQFDGVNLSRYSIKSRPLAYLSQALQYSSDWVASHSSCAGVAKDPAS